MSKRASVVAVSLVIVAASLATTRRAVADAPPPTAAAQLESRAAFDRGVRLYDLGEFAAAIVEFKRAYELAETPALLFNIAQAHAQLGAHQEALFLYESYLRAAPRAANRDDVESRMAELRAKLRKAAAPAPESATTASSSDRPRRRVLAAGLATVGVGVLFVASGSGLLGRAVALGERLERTPRGEMWNAYYESLDDDRRAARVGGGVLLGLGVGAMVTGSVVTAIAFRPKRGIAPVGTYAAQN